MCGICGFTGKHEQAFTHDVLQNMMQTMIHRGPDGEGTYYGHQIAMGFRRLSIIDLKDGGQPFYNETGNIVSICNGEIYNYLELRKELTGRGHAFTTECDAEVIVHAYEEWGEALTEHLRGMYAFVVWDSYKEKMIAVRDPFGIKPFYYSLIDDSLVFASEIKTILAYPGYRRIMNEEALEMYLSFQYSPLPETFFKGIFRLMPGSILIKDKYSVTVKRYFRPELKSKIRKNEMTCSSRDLEAAISDSVANHMRSDTEIGILLSGGVDSIYLASLAGVEKAYTVGFEEEGYNEASLAAGIAGKLHMKHRKYLISAEEYWDSVPEIQYMMDEPLADASAIALYFLDRMAAEEVKTVISGEGSDELFGGYPIYHEPLSLGPYQKLPLRMRKVLADGAKHLPEGTKGKGFLTRGATKLEDRFIGKITQEQNEEITKLLEEIAKQKYDIEQMKKTLEQVQANVVGDTPASQEKIKEVIAKAEEVKKEENTGSTETPSTEKLSTEVPNTEKSNTEKTGTVQASTEAATDKKDMLKALALSCLKEYENMRKCIDEAYELATIYDSAPANELAGKIKFWHGDEDFRPFLYDQMGFYIKEGIDQMLANSPEQIPENVIRKMEEARKYWETK